MRICVFSAVALCVAAVPALAQSRDVVGPWTLTPAIVMCADLPATVKPVPRLVIKGLHETDERITSSPGSALVIGRSTDDGLAVGQRYIVGRLQGDPRNFPRPGKGFGDVRLAGIITVTAIDDLHALANVDYACDTIEPGDFLEPFVEGTIPTTASPMAPPDFSDRGAVLFSNDMRILVGHGDVVSIDRGTIHGVTSGQRFAVYRDKHNGLPLIYVGELVVVTPSEQTSKTIVTVSINGIEAGDVVVPRRAAAQQ